MTDTPLFETNRLKAIRYSVERLDEMHAIYQDADIIKYTTTDGKPKSKEQLLKGIELYNTMYSETTNSRGKWLLVEKATNAVIGYVGSFYIDEIDKTELSYALLKQYRGQGYASEALEALKDYALDALKLTEICSLIRPDNTASEKVAQSVGMIYTEDVNVWGFDFKMYLAGKSLS